MSTYPGDLFVLRPGHCSADSGHLRESAWEREGKSTAPYIPEEFSRVPHPIKPTMMPKPEDQRREAATPAKLGVGAHSVECVHRRRSIYLHPMSSPGMRKDTHRCGHAESSAQHLRAPGTLDGAGWRISENPVSCVSSNAQYAIRTSFAGQS